MPQPRLSPDQVDFIMKMKAVEYLSGLFSSLERYFKSGGRSLSFRIF
jgi:hypothetical protein